jgi:hypothetical protein
MRFVTYVPRSRCLRCHLGVNFFRPPLYRLVRFIRLTLCPRDIAQYSEGERTRNVWSRGQITQVGKDGDEVAEEVQEALVDEEEEEEEEEEDEEDEK